MGLPHTDFERVDVTVVELAELTVAIPRWMRGGVFLPEQLQGDMLAAQFLMNHLPVWKNLVVAHSGGRRKQQAFQLVLRHLGDLWPGQATGLGTCEVIPHRGSLHIRGTGDLAITEPFEPSKTKYFFHFSHGHSLTGHCRDSCRWMNLRRIRRVKESAKRRWTRFRAFRPSFRLSVHRSGPGPEVDGIHRNAGRNQSESVDGIDRNQWTN